jgi:Probable lipid transfer
MKLLSSKLVFAAMVLSCLIASDKLAFAISVCKMSDDGISACLPSVRGSNPPLPPSNCCRAVRGADLPCLCSYQHSYLVGAMGINTVRAKEIPSKCGIVGPVC